MAHDRTHEDANIALMGSLAQNLLSLGPLFLCGSITWLGPSFFQLLLTHLVCLSVCLSVCLLLRRSATKVERKIELPLALDTTFMLRRPFSLILLAQRPSVHYVSMRGPVHPDTAARQATPLWYDSVYACRTLWSFSRSLCCHTPPCEYSPSSLPHRCDTHAASLHCRTVQPRGSGQRVLFAVSCWEVQSVCVSSMHPVP